MVKNRDRLASTGIPMGKPEKTRKTYIADVIVRRPTPTPPARAEQPMPLEPVLADAIFEHILRVIRASGEAMERVQRRSPG